MNRIVDFLFVLSLVFWGYIGWLVLCPEPTPTPEPTPAPVPKRRWVPPLPEEPPFQPMPRRALEPELPPAHDPRQP